MAFEVMAHVQSITGTLSPQKYFGAQWHVGHHDWSFETVKKLALDTDDIPHNDTNYEEKVNDQLRELESRLAKDTDVCKKDDNGEKGRRVIDQLNTLSNKIRRNVRGWTRYYVSAMSYLYKIEEM